MSEPAAAAAPGTAAAGEERLVAAPLVRRMAAFLYEGVLLFGVLAVAGLVYAVLVHQTSGIEHRTGLMATCFAVLGVYFIGLWNQAGQTLAMKTWHLRLLTDRGLPLSPRRALARYVASYVWFLPPLLLAGALHLPSAGAIFGVVGAWIVLYALASRLHPRGQFWHDALCGTAIVSIRAARPLPQ